VTSVRVLAVLVLALWTTGCWSRLGTHLTGIDNFGVVSEGTLYRGGQPSEKGIQTLRARGVRTIVNLRNDPDPREQVWAAAAGMQYVVIPSGCHNPSAEDLRSFLSIMEGRPSPPQIERPVELPVFVHCHAGRDRTGLFVAAYRVLEDHWSSDRAIREMDDYGHVRTLCPRLHPFVHHIDPAEYDAGRGN
jgi:tyrosine-protein phosphatase SIW14